MLTTMNVCSCGYYTRRTMPNIWLTTDWWKKETKKKKKEKWRMMVDVRNNEETDRERERRKNRRGTNDDNCALLFSVQRFLSLSLSFFRRTRKMEKKKKKKKEKQTTCYSTSACMTFVCLEFHLYMEIAEWISIYKATKKKKTNLDIRHRREWDLTDRKSWKRNKVTLFLFSTRDILI